jgi:hypothetical protein
VIGHTHTAAEWLAFLCLGLSGWAAGSALLYLICDTDLAYFDPRPALRTAGDWVLVEAVRSKDTVRTLPRDAALWLAALSMLLTAPMKGATS